jgi:hypothetical protein
LESKVFGFFYIAIKPLHQSFPCNRDGEFVIKMHAAVIPFPSFLPSFLPSLQSTKQNLATIQLVLDNLTGGPLDKSSGDIFAPAK